MLSKRLQTLLNVRERAALLRLYFDGTHVQSNLQSQFGRSRNQSFSTRKLLVPIYTAQGWLASVEKRCATITRDAHSSADDNMSAERVTENGLARKILVNSKKAPKSIGLPLETIETVSDEEAEKIMSRDWKVASASPDEILKAFKSLSCHTSLNSLSLSRDKHDSIVHALSDKIQDLNDEQLRQVCQCLLLWNIPLNIWPGYVYLTVELDKTFSNRLLGWSVEETLLFFDYWYQLRLPRSANFLRLVMRKLGKKPYKLDPVNFLHLMFLINAYRKALPNMYEAEYRLDGILEEFTANELAVIAMAFFKTETRFRDQKVVSKMQEKMLKEFDEVEEISISAIMKMSRYSMGLQELQVFCKVLDRVKSRVSKASVTTLIHIAQASAFVQCYDAKLMEMIIERFKKDIDSARLKDLDRLSWALSTFDYNSETPIYHTIVENLRDAKRKEEIARFPTIVPLILRHLSHAGVFPIDLIQECLSPEFLHRVYNVNVYKIGWDFFALENNLRIDVPEYNGPFLKNNIRDFLSKKYFTGKLQSKDNLVFSEKFTSEVAHVCKWILGSNTAVHIDQVLPHYVKPDLIVCLDEANNPVAPEPVLSKIPTGTIKYSPQESGNLRWIAIVLATQNQMLRGTTKYVGLMTCKIRQLKKIGYIPIVIPYMEWTDRPSLEAKQKYLRDMLSFTPDRKVSTEAL